MAMGSSADAKPRYECKFSSDLYLDSDPEGRLHDKLVLREKR